MFDDEFPLINVPKYIAAFCEDLQRRYMTTDDMTEEQYQNNLDWCAYVLTGMN